MSQKYIDLSVEFTNTYKKYINASPQVREAMCLKALYPKGLVDMLETDIFAGNADMETFCGFTNLPVVFNPKKNSQIAYFASMEQLEEYASEFPDRADEIHQMMEFWKKESTFVKILDEAEGEVRDYLFPHLMGRDKYGFLRKSVAERPLGSGFISGSFDSRIAGISPNFTNILKKGVSGLAEDIEKYAQINGESDYYKAARLSLELVVDTLEYYRLQAEKLIETADAKNKKELVICEQILKDLQVRAPQSLREAIQLIIIFTILTTIDNFGRMDTYLGDFLANDLDSGKITHNEALKYLTVFWQFIHNNCGANDTRIIIGGKGRKNEANADRFALLAIEATIKNHLIKPVLTLRLYDGQNPELYERALDSISEGCIYPMLYNDDSCIEGFMKSMNLPYEDAVDYTPIGCGEMVIAGKSIGSPNSTFRMLKALEATLHNGYDAISGAKVGISTGELSEFDTFDKLYNAFLKQLDARLEIDNKVHAWQKKITAREAGFVLASFLMDGCIEKGKDIFHGGVKYFGANLEGFGLTNVINSLAVIKKFVYDEKRYTLEKIVEIIDCNFEGYDEEWKLFKSVDKYGNNKPWVDEMKLPIEAFLNQRANYYAKQNSFDYCTVASVNPGGIIIGPATGASADGRKIGESFALANSPMPGTDISGLAAMLQSAARSENAHGGYVTNMNISRSTIVDHREQVSNMFKAYFKIGGQQLNINCFSKGDLERALVEPEKYRNLIVRVSGYSARFIDLDEVTQHHIMERTLY